MLQKTSQVIQAHLLTLDQSLVADDFRIAGLALSERIQRVGREAG
jgi:hypothetical protein